MALPGSPNRRDGCPPIDLWDKVVGGVLSPAEAQAALDHSTECPFCGQELRAALAVINDPPRSEEQMFLAQLPSAYTAWQHALAQRMSAAVALEVRSRTPRRTWWLAAAACIAGVAAAGIWYVRARGSPPLQEIASAYS